MDRYMFHNGSDAEEFFTYEGALGRASEWARARGGTYAIYKLVATVRAGETPIIEEKVEDADA